MRCGAIGAPTWRRRGPRRSSPPMSPIPSASWRAPAAARRKAAQAAGLVDRLGDRIAFGRRVAALAGRGDDKQAGAFAAIPLDRWVAAHAERRERRRDRRADHRRHDRRRRGAPGHRRRRHDRRAAARRAGARTGSRRSSSASIRRAARSPRRSASAPRSSKPSARGCRSSYRWASVAASGGYWVSTPADRIFAEPSTITGSIGVFGLLPTFKGTLAKLGLSADGVKTTPLSGEPDLLRGTSPEFDRLLQAGHRRCLWPLHRPRRRIAPSAARRASMRSARAGCGRAPPRSRSASSMPMAGSTPRSPRRRGARSSIRRRSRPLFIEKQPTMLSQLIGDLATRARRRQRPGATPSRASPRGPLDALLRRADRHRARSPTARRSRSSASNARPPPRRAARDAEPRSASRSSALGRP